MSLPVELYRHDKRLNSTLKPTGSKTTFNGVMLDGANVLNPRIAIRFSDPTATPTQYNYAFIKHFSERYYYIDNWVFDNGRWIAEMSVDVLASYKTEIGQSEQYIVRSSAKHFDYIVDGAYPTTALAFDSVAYMTIKEDSPWGIGGNPSRGCYIVGVINNDTNAVGSVSYYSFSNAQMKKLLEVLFGDGVNWLSIGDISEELKQALFNPFQYVVSCMWFPVQPVCASTVSALPYGWWTLPGVTAGRVNDTTYKAIVATFNVPKHHQSENVDDYLNCSPYTSCTAIVEPWGSFQIPLDTYRPTYNVRINADFATGQGILSIEKPDGAIVAYRDGVLGVPIQLSQMLVDPRGALSSAASTVGAGVKAVAAGSLAGVVGVAAGVVSTIEAAQPTLETKGATGCFMSFDMLPRIIVKTVEVVDRDVTRFGRPYMKRDTVGNHSGFVLCEKPSVTLVNSFPSETDAVNRFLADGFYYE